MTLTFADPKEWLLEITPQIQSQLWQQSQRYGTPSSRWRAYINQIALHAFLSWVKAEYTIQASSWYSSPHVPAFWEFVNGTAVQLNHRRVILIPSEAIDDRELEVPQEWVDIPSWAGDFYVAVQVKPDSNWVRFWGYTTHKDLKTLAQYDPMDRTYCIDEINLTKDLNAFWMAYQFCRSEDIKTVLSPLPELSISQAENILQQLGSSSIIFPRLELPFTIWGGLLDKEQWRQTLYQQRQKDQEIQLSRGKQPQEVNQKIDLSAWLQGIHEASWQAIETFFSSNTSSLAFNFRNSTSLNPTSIKRAKIIDLGPQPKSQTIDSQTIDSQTIDSQTTNSQKVILLVALIPGADRQIGIRIQLHPQDNEYLPNNIKLVLLSELGEIIQEVRSRVEDNYVQLKLFEGEVGECFNIQVILNGYQVTEKFAI